MNAAKACTPARIATMLTTLALAQLLTGCLVAGVSSSGGWFIWPGSFGILVVLLLLFLLLRRRR